MSSARICPSSRSMRSTSSPASIDEARARLPTSPLGRSVSSLAAPSDAGSARSRNGTPSASATRGATKSPPAPWSAATVTSGAPGVVTAERLKRPPGCAGRAAPRVNYVCPQRPVTQTGRRRGHGQSYVDVPPNSTACATRCRTCSTSCASRRPDDRFTGPTVDTVVNSTARCRSRSRAVASTDAGRSDLEPYPEDHVYAVSIARRTSAPRSMCCSSAATSRSAST